MFQAVTDQSSLEVHSGALLGCYLRCNTHHQLNVMRCVWGMLQLPSVTWSRCCLVVGLVLGFCGRCATCSKMTRLSVFLLKLTVTNVIAVQCSCQLSFWACQFMGTSGDGHPVRAPAFPTPVPETMRSLTCGGGGSSKGAADAGATESS
jgi:hypothetical protein